VQQLQGLKSACDGPKSEASAAEQLAEKVHFRRVLVAQALLCYRLFPQTVKPHDFRAFNGTADGSAPLTTRAVPYKAENPLANQTAGVV